MINAPLMSLQDYILSLFLSFPVTIIYALNSGNAWIVPTIPLLRIKRNWKSSTVSSLDSRLNWYQIYPKSMLNTLDKALPKQFPYYSKASVVLKAAKTKRLELLFQDDRRK